MRLTSCRLGRVTRFAGSGIGAIVGEPETHPVKVTGSDSISVIESIPNVASRALRSFRRFLDRARERDAQSISLRFERVDLRLPGVSSENVDPDESAQDEHHASKNSESADELGGHEIT